MRDWVSLVQGQELLENLGNPGSIIHGISYIISLVTLIIHK